MSGTAIAEQRRLARTILAIIVGVIVVFMVMSGEPGRVFTAIAQTSPSPTQTSEFQIQFVNPTQGTSLEVSNKSDGTDALIHLVAWVNKIPTGATVEFKLQSTTSGSREDTLGAGTFIAPDTYEFKWNANSPDGTYNLRAILFQNGVEVARDQEVVTINNTPAAPESPPRPPGLADESQSEAVDITYPSVGGSFGIYRPNPGNGPPNGIIDATSSAGTETISAYYSLSAPGSEPSWKKCNPGGTSETKANSADGIRCEVASGDNPASITAVALVAQDATEDLAGTAGNNDVADGHRVITYDQDPQSIELTPATQKKDPTGTPPAFPCSDVIKAVVKDQAGRKVADVNVDVAASRPTDRLSFDDTPTGTSANKPPENHPVESAADCEGTPAPGNGSSQQGEHEVVGEGDIKHLESSSDSDDAGSFSFRFHSPDTGVTQFTVYADEDSNDRQCSVEAQADGAVGWGQDPGTPVGLIDEDTSCPRPTPSGSTTSASPSASPSSSSPSPSASTSTPAPQPRTLTLASSRNKVTYGKRITLTGQIVSNDESCEDGEFVEITRRVHGTNSPRSFRSVVTDGNGRFELIFKPSKSADYRAIAPGHDNCADAASSPVTTLVEVRITLDVDDRSPGRGKSVVFTVTVRPGHKGTKVFLQRKKGGGFDTVDSKELDGDSQVRFTVVARWKGDESFRARWKGPDDDHEPGNSDEVKVTTHR